MATILSSNRGFTMYGGTASGGARTVTAHLADPARVSPDSAATADLSAAARVASATGQGRGAAGSHGTARASRAAASGTAPASRERVSRREDAAGVAGRVARAGRPSSFMRYASDNAAVRFIYAITTGPQRFAFYLAIVAAIVFSLYFPVRDLYVANRAGSIVSKQEAIRVKYNESIKAEVDSYLSKEGIEDAARKLGMVKPGEQPITVTGDSAQDGTSATGEATSTDVAKEEQAVYDDVPWYYQILDKVFLYNSADSQAVSSTGTSSASAGK